MKLGRALCNAPDEEDKHAAIGNPSEDRKPVSKTHKPKVSYLSRLSGTLRLTEEVHPAVKAWMHGQMAISFSGAGFRWPYLMGISIALRELGVLDERTWVAGASAGSFVAVFLKAGTPPERQVALTREVFNNFRQNGVMGRLEAVLTDALMRGLPEDAGEVCDGKTFLAVTRIFPFRVKMVHRYTSRQDVIKAVQASCYLPFYSNGGICMRFKNRTVMDGGVFELIPVPPEADYTVQVSSMPMEWLPNVPGCVSRPLLHHVDICLDKYRPWPLDRKTTARMGMEPCEDDWLLQMVERGKQDARSWASAVGFMPVLAAGRPHREDSVVRGLDKPVSRMASKRLWNFQVPPPIRRAVTFVQQRAGSGPGTGIVVPARVAPGATVEKSSTPGVKSTSFEQGDDVAVQVADQGTGIASPGKVATGGIAALSPTEKPSAIAATATAVATAAVAPATGAPPTALAVAVATATGLAMRPAAGTGAVAEPSSAVPGPPPSAVLSHHRSASESSIDRLGSQEAHLAVVMTHGWVPPARSAQDRAAGGQAVPDKGLQERVAQGRAVSPVLLRGEAPAQRSPTKRGGPVKLVNPFVQPHPAVVEDLRMGQRAAQALAQGDNVVLGRAI